jgi:hypothetical protein
MRNYQPRQDAFIRQGPEVRTRACDHAGCAQEGLFRAPRSRFESNSYYWFCLDHVQAYNKSWDYCAGMTPDDIERMLRVDTTWQRPSWPLGHAGMKMGRSFRDPLGLYTAEGQKSAPPKPRFSPAEHKAMAVLGIEPPLSLPALKRRYKEMARRHHPDANGGDKAAEERFKTITEAYNLLLGLVKRRD